MLYLENDTSSRLLNKLGPESVDCVVTSPPYKAEDGYSDELIELLGMSLKEVIKPQRLVFVNFGTVQEEPGRNYRVQQILSTHLTFCFDFIWAFSFEGKGRYSPRKGSWRPDCFHEKVFVYSKLEGHPKNYDLIDRLAVGVPYTDKSNLKRFGHERDLKCRGDVVFIPYPNKTGKEGLVRGYRHGFPPDLVRYCFRLAKLCPGELVLEPFCGFGTTLWVADEFGLDAFGFELNRERFDLCKQMADLLNSGEKDQNPVLLY